jgi:Fur family transcriptional regulator, ferric uptake regulator
MDRATKELFTQTLRNNGQSLTKTREAIFALLSGQEPQSMQELYRRGSHQFDRASLYRTINLFEKIDIIQRIYMGWKYKVELTDAFSQHHHHVSCLVCGTTVSVAEDEDLEKMIAALAAKHHIAATAHQLEIQGICDACRVTPARI